LSSCTYLWNQCLSPLLLWVRISIGARCTKLCDKVCQWLVAGRWFSPGTPVFSTNKTDRHDINEILLKVALNTITLKLPYHHDHDDPFYIILLMVYVVLRKKNGSKNIQKWKRDGATRLKIFNYHWKRVNSWIAFCSGCNIHSFIPKSTKKKGF
jgi:hypothetical protein